MCLMCTPTKLVEVNDALAPVLADVRDTGEVPPAKDKRFELVAHRVGIAPHSLQYHLKKCLIDFEIQDQRLVELKDLSQAISTAKSEYAANPTMQNATAYTSMLNTFMSLASEIEGQQDPEQAVTFIAETVMAPMSRKTLSLVAEELRSLRDSLGPILPKGQTSYVDSQLKGAVARVSNALRDSLDEGLKSVCGYYKVELEAKERKRAIDTAAPVQSSADAGRMLDDVPTDPNVH